MIKDLRTKAGLTQKQFAHALGIPVNTICCWEAGRRTPPEWSLRLIKYYVERELLK